MMLSMMIIDHVTLQDLLEKQLQKENDPLAGVGLAYGRIEIKQMKWWALSVMFLTELFI